MDWAALSLSLKIAATSTALLTMAGLPLAYLLAERRHPFFSFFEALFSLPLVLPPTVLGFYLLLLLGPLGLAFSFTGLVIASVISGLPLAFHSFLAAFRSVPRAYYENSWLLGEGRWGTFFRVGIPLAKEGLGAGMVLAFAHALGEFGVVLMIGGNIPGVSRTLSLALYDQVLAFDSAAANRSAAVLLGFSVISLAAVAWLRRMGRTYERT